jgi:hypothetical protein
MLVVGEDYDVVSRTEDAKISVLVGQSVSFSPLLKKYKISKFVKIREIFCVERDGCGP